MYHPFAKCNWFGWDDADCRLRLEFVFLFSFSCLMWHSICCIHNNYIGIIILVIYLNRFSFCVLAVRCCVCFCMAGWSDSNGNCDEMSTKNTITHGSTLCAREKRKNRSRSEAREKNGINSCNATQIRYNVSVKLVKNKTQTFSLSIFFFGHINSIGSHCVRKSEMAQQHTATTNTSASED